MCSRCVSNINKKLPNKSQKVTLICFITFTFYYVKYNLIVVPQYLFYLFFVHIAFSWKRTMPYFIISPRLWEIFSIVYDFLQLKPTVNWLFSVIHFRYQIVVIKKEKLINKGCLNDRRWLNDVLVTVYFVCKILLLKFYCGETLS